MILEIQLIQLLLLLDQVEQLLFLEDWMRQGKH